jgi:SAM-dependent methyltransferase
MDAKYRRSGAYHWRETDARQLTDFNAPLRARYRTLLSLAPPRSDLALDAGCGDGALSSRLLGRARRVVGIDTSRRALRLARPRVRAGAFWVCGRLEALPFRPGVFDLAVAADVLEHADDPGTAAAELGRVLRSAGSLLVSSPIAEPGAAPGRFHRREFGPGGLQALLSPRFERLRETRSHAGWLLRLYESRRPAGIWAKRLIDCFELAGIDPFGWPAGRGARQATLRGRPRPEPIHPPATSTSAAQVAGAMNRKCG